MIIALAGRRIDAATATTPRFPLANITLVKQRIATHFSQKPVHAIVSSGACGADLLALDVAGQLGIPRYMLLPCARVRFVDLSVTDRPGPWGPLFQQIYAGIRGEGKGHIKTYPASHDSQPDFASLNRKILQAATKLLADQLASNSHELEAQSSLEALIIWDGKPRGEDDITAAFATAAKQMNIPVMEVLTL